MRSLLTSLLFLTAAGCATAGAVEGPYYLDPSAGTECMSHCQTLGMKLDAVVVIMQHTGCVCAPAGSARSTGGAAAAASGVTIAAAAQSQNQQQSSAQQAPARR